MEWGTVISVLGSGVIAALISVAGVIFSNRNSVEMLDKQLRHDKSEKASDRLSELRKGVYLELSAELTRAGSHLGALAGKDPTDKNLIEPFTSALAALAKVQVVGSPETAAHAMELTSVYGESIASLLKAAQPLHNAMIDVKIATRAYDEHMEDARRVVSEMRAINESGQPNKAKFEALSRSYQHAKAAYTEEEASREEAWKKYTSNQPTFNEHVYAAIEAIGPVQISLLHAIRCEIGLDSNMEQLLERLRSNQARMKAAVEDVFAAMQEDSK